LILQSDTKSIVAYKHTLSAQRSLMKTDTTEHFTTALEANHKGSQAVPPCLSDFIGFPGFLGFLPALTISLVLCPVSTSVF